jgi:hypothetical protein
MLARGAISGKPIASATAHPFKPQQTRRSTTTRFSFKRGARTSPALCRGRCHSFGAEQVRLTNAEKAVAGAGRPFAAVHESATGPERQFAAPQQYSRYQGSCGHTSGVLNSTRITHCGRRRFCVARFRCRLQLRRPFPAKPPGMHRRTDLRMRWLLARLREGTEEGDAGA